MARTRGSWSCPQRVLKLNIERSKHSSQNSASRAEDHHTSPKKGNWFSPEDNQHMASSLLLPVCACFWASFNNRHQNCPKSFFRIPIMSHLGVLPIHAAPSSLLQIQAIPWHSQKPVGANVGAPSPSLTPSPMTAVGPAGNQEVSEVLDLPNCERWLGRYHFYSV